MHHPATLSRPAPLAELPQALDDSDARHLRRAIAWACTARARGNPPFGAVLVGPRGNVLAEAYCQTHETGDSTAHAEMQALRQIGDRVPREVLAQSTLYASTEPCVMCAGAIFWAGIGRVVFGLDARRLRVLRGSRPEQRDIALSCRAVFSAAPHPIDCVGPALVAEASAPHVGYWRA